MKEKQLMMRYLCPSLDRYIIIIVVLTVFVGCTKQILPQPPPPQNITEYKTYKNQNDIGVAIDLFFEKERQLQYFDADLSSCGILPVQIIIGNNNKQPILIGNKNITYLSSNISSTQIVSLPNAKVNSGEKGSDVDSTGTAARGSLLAVNTAVIVMAAGSIGTATGVTVLSALTPLAPIGLIAAIPMGIYAYNQMQMDPRFNARTAIHNATKKALYDKSIFKAGQHHGFIYIPLKNIRTDNRYLILQVKIKELSTEKTYDFTFDIDTTKIKNKNDDANKGQKTKDNERQSTK